MRLKQPLINTTTSRIINKYFITHDSYQFFQIFQTIFTRVLYYITDNLNVGLSLVKNKNDKVNKYTKKNIFIILTHCFNFLD